MRSVWSMLPAVLTIRRPMIRTMKNIALLALAAKRRFVAAAQGRYPALGFYAMAALALVAASSQAHAQGFFGQGTPPSFTANQAARGKTAYATNCLMCHGSDLDDGQFGPALKGPSFSARWSGQSAETLFSSITRTMPPSGPGSLSNQTYADIFAYILQANGVPSGTAEFAMVQAIPKPAAPTGADAAKPPQASPFGSFGQDAVFKAAIRHQEDELAKITPVTDAMLQHPADADWLVWRRTYQNLGYSPLNRINKANVSNLNLGWSLSLPISADEITPLVHDGVVFVESGNSVQALDGATGDPLWQYVRPLADTLYNGRNSRMKNLAIYQDKLYAPTADGHLIALYVKTGKLAWDHEIIPPEQGSESQPNDGIAVHLNGGPIVAKGSVIIGESLGITTKGGGFIVGLNAQTGRELWRFYTIARPGQPGGDSWNGAPVDQRFGAGVWTSGSYDPDLNLVYFGTGNTYDTATLLEPQPQKGESDDGLYTDSTVALEPETGKLVWYYQHMNRDVWDLDWVFEQSLITLPVDGRPRNLVVTGGKIAVFDAVDRADGKYEFSVDLGLQNLVSAIDRKTGRKIINPTFTPEAGKTKFLCPSSYGARNWPATAFDLETDILYVPLVETCTDFTWVPRDAAETAAGGMDIRGGPKSLPNTDGNFGRVEAINLKSRQVVWTRRQRAPIASSMLATGGGIVFSGARDRRFRAYDAANGKVLWQARLNAVPSSSPVTYGVKGEQYVAVVTGGGGPFDAGTSGLAPEISSPAGGTVLWVFKLPNTANVATQH
jgi:alcohol dehydrogenase (cytochrome c)